MSLSEEAESESETSDESASSESDIDYRVENYNEKFENLIYTSTDVIQQII